ncbi:hypothetical protein [Streptomyces sp. NPDC017095]|uniref:hypothetical protein n=1 Tax=Streptomyces sp. NPDC017095 TaxID=3364977 RepID=UPI0037A77A56
MAEQKSSSALTAPLRGAASVLRRVPGAGTVGRAAEGTLDKIGAVSPRGRRIAVYAGAGVLGAAGVVEWPVAVTGAAVAWLTQPRPARPASAGPTAGQGPGLVSVPESGPERAHDLGTAALRSGADSGHGGDAAEDTSAGTGVSAGADEAPGPVRAIDPGRSAKRSKGSGHHKKGSGHRAEGSVQPGEASGPAESAPGVRTSSSPLGPTARPDRTTL